MRILFWSCHFWPHVGGVEVLGAHFVAELSARGHDVVVVTSRDVEDLAPEATVAGVLVRRLPFRAALERNDATALDLLLREVRRIRRDAKPDLVHLFQLGPDALVYELTRRGSAAAEVATLHGPFPPNLLAPDAPVGRVLRRAQRVVGCSQSTLDAFVEHVPDARPRTSVVPNALPQPAWPYVAPPSSPTILMLGRAVPQKGFDLGLDAFAAVLRGEPRARLVVAGDGVDLRALRCQARRLGIADAVSFRGWVYPREVPELIEAAALVLMPSRFEGHPLVAIEAARGGRPVVGFAVPGMPEAVAHGETGVLVEPEDPPALARAVLDLLASPATAERLGRTARRRLGTDAPWTEHVDAYERVYGEALTARLT
jgi:glycosyltransferase involved in cell wall biosynthesis